MGIEIGIELPSDGTLLEHAQHELMGAVSRHIGGNWAVSVVLYPAVSRERRPSLIGEAEGLCERYAFWFFLWKYDFIELGGVQEPNKAVIAPRSETLIYSHHERSLDSRFFRVLGPNRLLFFPREHYWRDVRICSMATNGRRVTDTPDRVAATSMPTTLPAEALPTLTDLQGVTDSEARVRILLAVHQREPGADKAWEALKAARRLYGIDLAARPELLNPSSSQLGRAWTKVRKRNAAQMRAQHRAN